MNTFPFDDKDDISPENWLDTKLNARTPVTTNDDATEPEGESLAGAAQQFHAWADAVQARDRDAKGPADDLWNRILNEQSGRGRFHTGPIVMKDAFGRPNVDTPGDAINPLDERKGNDMSAAIHTPIEEYVPPQSHRTRKANEYPRTRSGGWFSAIAAALLLLSLGGGAFLAGNGGFGFGGGGGEGRYAAQVASPEASPEMTEVIGMVAFQADGVCEAEPLTEDQVFDIVMNPLNGFAQQGVVLEEVGTPEPLMEVSWQGSGHQRPSAFPDPNPLHRATEGEAASVNAFVTEYYECLESGTSFQVWGLIFPYDVQTSILANFPVLRSEEQIRNYIEEFGPQDHSATWPGQQYDYYFDQGYSFQGNPNPLSLWVNPNYGFPDVVILSGVSMVDESGDVVAEVDYDGRPVVLQPNSPGAPETLEIAYFAETNTWYISGTYSLKG